MPTDNDDDWPSFPIDIFDKVTQSRVYFIEVGDIQNAEDLQKLISLLYTFPESEFYYFVPKEGGEFGMVNEQNGILTNEIEFFYYKHPNFAHDFIRIKNKGGEYAFDWEREVVEREPMFMRVPLQLATWKKRELEIQQKIETERSSNTQLQATIQETSPNPIGPEEPQPFLRSFRQDNPDASKCVFISYAWEDEDHKQWVKMLATRLRGAGINVTLDTWHTAPGDQLPHFMEKAIRDNEFILIVCTPTYKMKSDQRLGGVGYEGDIMTGEAVNSQNKRKFIPVLRKGEWQTALPSWMGGKYGIDLRDEPYSEVHYNDLRETLCKTREEAPPIGQSSYIEGTDSQKSRDFSIRPVSSSPTQGTEIHDGIDSGGRAAVLAELEQNVGRFKRLWEKLESQRATTLDQSMEQAFIEATVPLWSKVAFDQYVGTLDRAFTLPQVRAIHSIYSYLNDISALQREIQQAKEQGEKVLRKQMDNATSGIYNSSSEPFWNAEIKRYQQKSGDAWRDLVQGKRDIEANLSVVHSD